MEEDGELLLLRDREDVLNLPERMALPLLLDFDDDLTFLPLLLLDRGDVCSGGVAGRSCLPPLLLLLLLLLPDFFLRDGMDIVLFLDDDCGDDDDDDRIGAIIPNLPN